ncbi:MAG: TlyA family RNA methyltransferase [Acholeplasmatales bacterium]
MRLDNYIKENFNISRSRALDLIKLSSVKVNNEIVIKPSYQVKEDDVVEIIETLKYASRAGEKLEDAIINFNLDFKNKTILDVGSSTGGFTDCSLSFGAKHVYAYDVGVDQMVLRLKEDKRVTLNEGVNILSVTPEEVDICLIDVSFTSIKPIITHLKDIAKRYVLLFKPQFEVGQKHLKKGIVKDVKVVNKYVEEFKDFLKELSLNVIDYKSVLKGKKGNQEYIFVCERC